MKVLYYAFVTGILFCLSSLAWPSAVSAAGPVVFQDDFSSGSLEKWQDVRNKPNTFWSVVDGQAEARVMSGSTLAELVPKDEYWDPSWHDFTYDFDYMALSGVDRNVSWNFIDPNNWYEVHFVGTGFQVARVKNAQLAWLASGQGFFYSKTKVHITIKVQGDLVQVYLDSQLVFSQPDPTFDQAFGKIGLKAGAGTIAPTIARFDNIVVRLLDPLPTPEPSPSPTPTISHLITDRLSQADPSWANQEYDHAVTWAPPDATTIEDWGCALTSLVMILTQHEITQLPDGTMVTPASLNTWLKSQPDGYIGQGLLNWIAALRMVRESSEKYHHTKLEYASSSPTITDPTTGAPPTRDKQLEPARAEVTANRPVILEIDGHFLVGDGIVQKSGIPQPDDLAISDPSYNYELFSQHDTDVISTRSFTPSQTDLSYIVVAADDALELSLTRPDGNIVSSRMQKLNAHPVGTQVSGTMKLIELPKPEAGIYLLTISGPPLTDHRLTIFTYDQLANLTDLSENVILGTTPTTMRLSYNSAGENSTQLVSNQAMLSQELSQLTEQKFIHKQYVRRVLTSIANHFPLTGLRAEVWRYYLDWYRPQIEPNTYQFLLKQTQAEEML